MPDLRKLRQQTGAARCLACGKCTTTCPLATGGRFSARVIAAQDLEDETAEQADLVGRCLTCAACEVYCPQGIDFTDYVRGLRDLYPTQAPGPCPHDGVFQCAARTMAASEDVRRNRDWLGADLQIAEEGELAYFVGCLPLFDTYFRGSMDTRPLDIARASVRLLNAAGIKPVLLDDERCCGHDLLWAGDREGFEALAQANTKAFASRGIKQIVTSCAECCRTWRSDYPEVASEYRPKVQHLSEFLAPKVEAGEVGFRVNGKETFTFQDPCRLARHLGVTDAPRQVLDALPGTRRVEMNRSGRQADCCGTSGFIYCDAESRRLQSQRLRDAASTGAKTLVTACPKCLIHFSCAQEEDRRTGKTEPNIQIKDFTVVAAAMLPRDGAPKEKRDE